MDAADTLLKPSDVREYEVAVADFETWRNAARRAVMARIEPERLFFIADDAPDLFRGMGGRSPLEDAASVDNRPLVVPPAFLDLAEWVSFHSHADRWARLYRALWRMTHGERHLMDQVTDPDMAQLLEWQKQVRRDCHKMKAFVRFRRTEDELGEHFIAWHRPDHPIVRRVAPFFSRRFAGMRWTILTPRESVHWDGQTLQYGPGAPGEALAGDELEAVWKTYYANTFNPARIKIAMMKREMPTRHWPTLPETEIIASMLADAPRRVQAMIDRSAALAALPKTDVPSHRSTWDEFRQAQLHCQNCDLHCRATQTVLGEGPTKAHWMIVGEQPGDAEDLAGRPFVGPAGRLLDQLLEEQSIDRSAIYLTNAVKHFRFEDRGPIRLHKTPSARHQSACRPWLEAEIQRIAPRVVMALGATALKALVGPQVKLTAIRGQWLEHPSGAAVLASWHPSAILRMSGDLAAERRGELARDLATAERAARG